MGYLLDTDWTIDRAAKRPAAIELLRPLRETGLAISVITYMEAYEGALRLSNTERDYLVSLVREFENREVTRPIAERCAELRERVRAAGRRIRNRSLDLIIAATAIEHGLTLVSRDIDDFSDVPGLLFHQP